mgnify:CR=1 FL=1
MNEFDKEEHTEDIWYSWIIVCVNVAEIMKNIVSVWNCH